MEDGQGGDPGARGGSAREAGGLARRAGEVRDLRRRRGRPQLRRGPGGEARPRLGAPPRGRLRGGRRRGGRRPRRVQGRADPGRPTDPDAESNPDEQRLASDDDEGDDGDGEATATRDGRLGLGRRASASPPRGVSARPPRGRAAGPDRRGRRLGAALLDVLHEQRRPPRRPCRRAAARAAGRWPCAAPAARAPSDGTTTQRCRCSMPSAMALPACRQRIGPADGPAGLAAEAGRAPDGRRRRAPCPCR